VSDAGTLGWYAVWTRSRAEKSVRDQLIRKGVEVFLPTVIQWSRWKDRRKQVEWPLFPGYCFVNIDPRHKLPVISCDGVVHIVSVDGKAAEIPEEQITAIRQLVFVPTVNRVAQGLTEHKNGRMRPTASRVDDLHPNAWSEASLFSSRKDLGKVIDA